MDIQNTAALFDALSSPVRLNVLLALVDAGKAGMVAGEIATQVDVTPTNLSFHLRALTRSELIDVFKEGRFLRYRANFGFAAAFVDDLVERVGRPAARLSRSSGRKTKK